MAELLILLLAVSSFGTEEANAFLGNLAKNVATTALSGGLAAATGAQPLTTGNEALPLELRKLETTAGNQEHIPTSARGGRALPLRAYRERKQSFVKFCG